MAKRPRKQPRDLNKLAASIVAMSTSERPAEESPPENSGKNPHAVALGKLGGRKGGKARAAKLTAEQREEAARAAAHARWKKKEG